VDQIVTLRYFKIADFACHHCGENKIDYKLVEMIDELRHQCGFPIGISSGYRCPDHNVKVSSTGRNGPHTTGRAADLAVSHKQALTVLRKALAMDFTGFGVQQKGDGRFIHLDTLPNGPAQPRPHIWSY
jgi:zinc D-Ala-D-Ala carboxypeptidase